MENCKDNIKTTVKRGKNQIEKEEAITNVYDEICDYLDILEKRIHIQQRTLACQSKALSDKLQRDHYLMDNAGLIRRYAKMIHL